MALSLSHMKLSQQGNVTMLKMAMDTAKGQTEDISQIVAQSMKSLDETTKAMEQSVFPYLGKNIDVYL